MKTRSELYGRLSCYLMVLGFLVLGLIRSDSAKLVFLVSLLAIALWDCGILLRRIRAKISN